MNVYQAFFGIVSIGSVKEKKVLMVSNNLNFKIIYQYLGFFQLYMPLFLYLYHFIRVSITNNINRI